LDGICTRLATQAGENNQRKGVNGRFEKWLGQIIKRRIRLHEPALKALTICIVFVFTGIFLRFSTPLSIPKFRDSRSANGKLWIHRAVRDIGQVIG